MAPKVLIVKNRGRALAEAEGAQGVSSGVSWVMFGSLGFRDQLGDISSKQADTRCPDCTHAPHRPEDMPLTQQRLVRGSV